MGWKDDPVIGGGWQSDPVIEDTPRSERVSAGQAALISAGHWLDKKAAGLREAVGAIPGFGQSIVSGLDAVDRLTGVQTPDAAQYRSGEVDQRLEPVRKQQPVASFVGDFLPSVAVINPASMATLAAVDPGSMTDRAMRAGVSYGVGKAGEYAGGKLGEYLTKRADTKAAQLAAQQVASTSRDQTLAEARAAGLVFPPDQINPNPINRALTGLAGKASTQQAMALKNESVLQDIAKSELGIPEDVPLTKEAVATVRKAAGSAYESLKGFGKITADEPYAKAITDMTAEYRGLVNDFPELANSKIEGLVKTMQRPEFNSASAVELVKRLRSDGKANLRAVDDPEKMALGKMQLAAQNAIEDLMDRNLAASGNAGFLDIFRRARTLIAKAHTVEDSLQEGSGKIIASKIKGKNLTGGLATIQKANQLYPKSLQNVNSPSPGVSPLDFLAGIGVGQAGGAAAGLGVPLVRPAVRGILTSDLYQGLMATPRGYDLGAFEKLLKRAGASDLSTAGGLLGPLGLQYAP